MDGSSARSASKSKLRAHAWLPPSDGLSSYDGFHCSWPACSFDGSRPPEVRLPAAADGSRISPSPSTGHDVSDWSRPVKISDESAAAHSHWLSGNVFDT